MAESSVEFIIQKLNTLILQEKTLPSGIRNEVEDIRDGLESMRAFLKDADLREEADGGVKTWIKQVREVSYDTEDAIDEFMLLPAKLPESHNGFTGCLRQKAYFIKYWRRRHSIANQIQSINKRIESIYQRSQRYQFIRLDQVASSSNYKPDPRGDNALLVSESELVGIDKRREEMQRLLVEGDPKLKVVPVVGMCGLGKTTLVKKVFAYEGVKEIFECRAWISVLQSIQIEQMLRDMIKQLFKEANEPMPQGFETMGRVGLNNVLKEFLQRKRYVIVLDDIWSIDAWDALKYAFPDSNNCSRIMITTRIAEVASFCSRSNKDIYELSPLNQEEAWDLFCRKVFQSHDQTCPSTLQDVSQNILTKCGGLPLAIVVIASLLLTKDNIIEWQRVLPSLHTGIESNAKLHNMMKIVMLSYSDLPYYLKSCLLYLSIFPEDYRFKRTKMVRLWVAEGLVEDTHGSKAEDVGESYFNDLVSKNFIQAAPDPFEGYKVKWQVHDIIHEIILQKSRDQNFATILAEEQSTTVHPKIRRLSIHKNSERMLISWNESKSLSHLRTLLLFDISSVPTFSWGFRLLKVLDLEGAPLEVFPQEIVRLFHLRFLSLKRTKIRTVLPSIELLSKLETLDLKHTFVTKLPAEIIKLTLLRHLLVYHEIEPLPNVSLPFDFLIGSAVPSGIGNLEFLQTLTHIEVNSRTNIASELGRLTRLKRLGITKLRTEDGIHLCASIDKLKNLRYLDIRAPQEEIVDLDYFTSPSPHIRRLKIVGHLTKVPRWIPSIHNLERVAFDFARFTTDPLEALQALPRLVELSFHKAYYGEELRFQAGGFPKLMALMISDLENLRLVTVEEGAMPLVKSIWIFECPMLERAPLGIEFMENLKRLRFLNMPPKFVEELHQVRGQEIQRALDIPNVEHMFWRGGMREVQYV